VIALLVVLIEQIPKPPPTPSDIARADRQTVLVRQVVDGDTFVADMPDGSSERVRLIGVDAPEGFNPDTQMPDHWGRQAGDYLRARTLGKQVLLQIDPLESRDRYSRLLAYVWLENDELINLSLVRDGQAYAYRPKPGLFGDQTNTAEGEALRARRGLWGDVTKAKMPAWRRRWMDERGIDWP
jgi:micrococcal nuclease